MFDAALPLVGSLLCDCGGTVALLKFAFEQQSRLFELQGYIVCNLALAGSEQHCPPVKGAMATTTWFAPYCPQNDVCKKSWSRLGTHSTKEAAIAAVVHHLTASSHHYLTAEAAEELALTAVIDEEEWPEDQPPADDTSKGKSDMSKGKPAGKGKGKSRTQPYDGKGGGKSSKHSQMAVVAHLPQQEAAIIESLTKSAAAMRTSARFARQAASAFDEEAATVEGCLRRLTGQDQFTFGGSF